jgi:hypothetical protein
MLAGKYDELLQESLEGIGGGAMAGVGLLGGNVPLSQVGIQTLAAMAGGVGVGMLGTRLGAALGKRLHPQALKNQAGPIATFGRGAGQKTLISGPAEIMRYGKGQIKQELREQTTSQLMDQALQNPQAFANKYGVDAEMFKKYQSSVSMAGQGRALMETLERIPPEAKKEMAGNVRELMNQGFNQVENLINTQAALRMDDNLAKMAMLQKGKVLPGTNIDLGSAFESLLKDPQVITGEHVGRAVGRFIGDEIGIIGGLTAGGALAGAVGIKNDKDKKIEELERQLGRSY